MHKWGGYVKSNKKVVSKKSSNEFLHTQPNKTVEKAQCKEVRENRIKEQNTSSAKYPFLNLTDYNVTLTIYSYYIYSV